MRRQRNKNCSWKTNSGFDLNACETVTRQCQECIPESCLPTDQPTSHDVWPFILMLAKLSISAIIVYHRAVQANNVELISRVIWQSVTPLLELFRRDKGRHSGVWLAPHVWPATRLDHLGSFSGERNFYFNAELQPQTESAPLMNCQIGIRNIFILRDKSLEGKK